MAAVGQCLVVALMIYAGVDSAGDDQAMFWALAGCAALNAGSAAWLSTADRRTAEATDRINQAVVVIGIGFCVGALGALLAGNPLVLVVPFALVLINAMLVAAARRVQSQAVPG